MGLTLYEPLSSITNWVMAVQCIFYYTRLREGTSAFQKTWAWFFLAYGVSFVFGGISHLFFHYLDFLGKIPVWSLAVLATAAGELAMITETTDEKKRQTLLLLIRSKLFAALLLLILDFSFKWVMVQIFGMFVLLTVLSLSRFRLGQLHYKSMLIGLVCLLMTAPVKIGGVDIHPAWFNRDDLAHVFMILAFWMFFRTIAQAPDRSALIAQEV